VRATVAKLEPWAFEPTYEAWWERVIPAGGKAVVAFSVRRYIAAVSGASIKKKASDQPR
jgi:hypothetical protein